MMHSSSASILPGYLKEIDGLRAIAVLSVMLYHLQASFLPGGFAGVDVFFVISGYVVSKSIAERPFKGVYSYIVEFYSRRIVRILPALIFCVVITAFLAALFIPFSSWLSQAIEKTGRYALLGFSNFILVAHSDGYFSTLTEFNPFTHTWSLAVEEQFYFIFPFVFFAWIYLGRRGDFARTLAVLVLPLLAIASLYVAWWSTSNNPDWAYFMLPARFWELAAGVMLYQLHSRQKCLPTSHIQAGLILLSGLLVVFAGLWFSQPSSFPWPWALLPVIGTVLMIHGVIQERFNTSALHAVLRNPIAVYIGKISYSLYLWHWAIYVIFRWTVGLEGLPNMLVAVTLTFIMGAFSYHFVETPFRTSKRIAVLTAGKKVLYGLLVLAFFYVLTKGIFKAKDELSLSVTQNKSVWGTQIYPITDPSQATYDFAGRQIFAVGNSHVLSYDPMLHEAEQRHALKVHTHYTACAVGSVFQGLDASKGCLVNAVEIVDAIIHQAQPGDLVFFASLRTHRLADQWALHDPAAVLAGSRSDSSMASLELGKQEAIDMIEKLTSAGLKVLIDAPKPVFPTEPYRCSDWFNYSNPWCDVGFEVSAEYLQELRAPVMEVLDELDRNYDAVYIWDPFFDFCPGSVCSPFDDEGLPLFFDGDHMTAQGNRHLYPSFERALYRVWNDGLSAD